MSLIYSDDAPEGARDPEPPPLGMWDDERCSPWTSALLYALVLVAALLASHFYAWGFAS